MFYRFIDFYLNLDALFKESIPILSYIVVPLDLDKVCLGSLHNSAIFLQNGHQAVLVGEPLV